jgi:hypothetical protein
VSEDDDLFRIEDESDEDREAKRQREERAAAAAAREDVEVIDVESAYDAVSRRSPAEVEVDTRTVAERRGEAVGVETGAREPPPGWPLEALAFPWRRPGWALILGSAAVWTALDVLCLVEPVAALGYLLKLLLLPFFLQWFLHVVGQSAAGYDRPAGWLAAMELDRDRVVGLGRLLVVAALLAVPPLVAGKVGRDGLAVVLLVVGSLWLSAGALGQALGAPGLLWPWNALAWVGRRPLALLVGASAAWAIVLAEIAVKTLGEGAGTPAGEGGGGLSIGSAIACLGIRLALFYVWLVAARALGVAGRSWTL